MNSKQLSLTDRKAVHTFLDEEIEIFIGIVEHIEVVERLKAAERHVDSLSLDALRRELACSVDRLLNAMNLIPLLAPNVQMRVTAYHDLVLRAFFALKDPTEPFLPEAARSALVANARGYWNQTVAEGHRTRAFLVKTISLS